MAKNTPEYKFPLKPVFSSRALIALEEMAKAPLHQVIIDMTTGSFKSTVLLLAASTKMDYEEALQWIDDEIVKGLNIKILNESLEEAFESSVFFKNPAIAELVQEENKKLTEA